ncbi:hypothetical protein ACFL6U_31005, partial [Planctomycetota bacterium]
VRGGSPYCGRGAVRGSVHASDGGNDNSKNAGDASGAGIGEDGQREGSADDGVLPGDAVDTAFQ